MTPEPAARPAGPTHRAEPGRPRRLIVIGTSHVAAFIEGWRRISADHPDWEVEFFATPALNFAKLRLDANLRFEVPPARREAAAKALKSVNAVNGRDWCDLSAADVVLRVGDARTLGKVATFLAADAAEPSSRADGRAPRAAFGAFCADIAARRAPSQPWRDWNGRRLVIHLAPSPAETILETEGPDFAAWTALARRPDGRALLDAFLDGYAAELARHGIRLLRQPAATLQPSGLTAKRYAAGSRRLRGNSGYSEDDHRHMNAEYGVEALTALFAALADGDPSPDPGARRRPQSLAAPAVPATAPAPSPPPAEPARAPMRSPYADLPSRAFWRSAVAERAPLEPGDLYRPRFTVTRKMRIATAGSCFAQHIGRALRGAGFDVIDAEPLPAAVSDATAHRFGYRLFSARYANVYTARQLAQLYDEACGRATPALPVWTRDGRFFDAQRPGVEPDGFDTEARVLAHRQTHLAGVRDAFHAADLFVFTFGLTEAWIHAATGTVYPTAPGTIAGAYDPETFAFKNYDAVETLGDFEAFRARLKAANPGVRFLVTVSPVALTATAAGEHVEVATCYSKAVLRAVCGMLVARHDDVDYFPSFELITSQTARAGFYEPNLRNVSERGVATAMSLFLGAHGIDPKRKPADAGAARRPDRGGRRTRTAAEQCEEVLLDAFAR